MIGRFALFGLAAAVLAFLLPQALEDHDLRRGKALAGSPATAQQARDALRSARQVSLTGEPRVLEAQLLLFGDRPAEAAAVVLPLAEREPDNLLAWRTVAAAARESGDLDLQRRAAAKLAELDPRSARR